MPRYFFHILNSVGYAEDDEGSELADIDVARREAIAGVRSILSEEVREGRIDLRGRIDVVDADGKCVLSVPFSEAVEVIPGQPLQGEGELND